MKQVVQMLLARSKLKISTGALARVTRAILTGIDKILS